MHSLTEPDYMAFLHDYISDVTGMSGDRIFRGDQSRMVLPKSGPYCIYTPLLRRRRGTNVLSFDAKNVDDDTNGTDSLISLVLVDVQVDFYMLGAAQNAQALEIASRSYYGTDYFGDDIRVVSAESPKNLTGLDMSGQYAERWMVTITAEINSAWTTDLPWFEDVHFRHRIPGTDPPEYVYGLINVDEYFPPTD